MRIILARHGQTEMNRDQRILGAVDSPLTERGRLSARRLGELVAELKPQRVFASPLGRVQATAKILCQGLELAIQPRAEMAELSAGRWEGLTRQEALGEEKVIRQAWGSRPPGGESYQDGEERLRLFLEELRGLPGTTLVVGHFAINRSFLKSWLGLEEERVMAIDVPHEVLYLLENGAPVGWLDYQGKKGQGFLEFSL